jgi:hypothetical protein
MPKNRGSDAEFILSEMGSGRLLGKFPMDHIKAVVGTKDKAWGSNCRSTPSNNRAGSRVAAYGNSNHNSICSNNIPVVAKVSGNKADRSTRSGAKTGWVEFSPRALFLLQRRRLS